MKAPSPIRQATLWIVGLALLAATISAQQLASLSGYVTDANAAVVENATIKLTNTQTGESYTVTTNGRRISGLLANNAACFTTQLGLHYRF